MLKNRFGFSFLVTLLLVLVLVGCTGGGGGGTKTGQLEGKIYEDGAGTLVMDTVTVEIVGEKRITENGKFEFTKVPIGDKTLTAQAVGYKPFSKSVTIQAGKKVRQDIYLEKDTDENIPVTDVTLNQTTISLVVGTSETLEAIFEPSNATNKTVTWTSDDDSIAEVDATGKVTGIGVGITTIIVKTSDGEKTAICSVEVKPIAVTGITLDRSTASIKLDSSTTLIATVKPADAANKKVTWSSNNDSIATVEANGKVTGKGFGTATITATTEDGGKIASCIVTVPEIYIYLDDQLTDLNGVLPSGLFWDDGTKVLTMENYTGKSLREGSFDVLTLWVVGDNVLNSGSKGALLSTNSFGREISIDGPPTATLTLRSSTSGHVTGGIWCNYKVENITLKIENKNNMGDAMGIRASNVIVSGAGKLEIDVEGQRDVYGIRSANNLELQDNASVLINVKKTSLISDGEAYGYSGRHSYDLSDPGGLYLKGTGTLEIKVENLDPSGVTQALRAEPVAKDIIGYTIVGAWNSSFVKYTKD